MKDNTGFILAWDVDKTVTFGVISTAEWLHSKPQTTGGEKDFMESLVSQGWVLGLTCRSKQGRS